MSIQGNNPVTYIGVISYIPVNGKDKYEVRVDIPSLKVEGAKAIPESSSSDEPQVGNVVQLTQQNTTLNSTYLYKILKNSDYTGTRSHGNTLTMNDDGVTMGISTGWERYTQDADLPCDSYINFGKDGSITIAVVNDGLPGKIKIIGNADVEILSDGNITVGGKSTINIIGSGEININSSESNININAENSCNITSKNDINLGTDGDVNITSKGSINMTAVDINLKSDITDFSDTNLVSSKAMPTKTVPTTVPVIKI